MSNQGGQVLYRPRFGPAGSPYRASSIANLSSIVGADLVKSLGGENISIIQEKGPYRSQNPQNARVRIRNISFFVSLIVTAP